MIKNFLHLPLVIGLLGITTMHAQVDMNSLMQQAQGGAFGGVTIVEDTDPFTPNVFVGSIRMEIRSFEKDTEAKDSPMRMRYHSREDMTLMEPEVQQKGMEQMKVLTDLKGKWQYTLMTDKKGKRTAMKMKKMKVVVQDDGTDTEAGGEPRVERGTETRTIHGQRCTKYTVTDEDGTWTGWVAEGVPTPFMDMARSVSNGKGGGMDRTPSGLDGMPMEYEYVSADGKERMEVKVTEFSLGAPDEKFFSLAGYEVMEMPTMNFGR
jgi:hypothetical protein